MKKNLRLAFVLSVLFTGVTKGEAPDACNPDFLSAARYVMGGPPQAIFPVDLDGDGLLDLVTATSNYQRVISVRLGKPDGTFGPQIDKQGNFQVLGSAVANFTNDSDPDMVVSGYGTLFLFKGNGDGTFQDPVGFGTESLFVLRSADVNGDGKADLIGVDNYTGQINVLLGNGDGTFQDAILTTPKQIVPAFAIGDVDGDGKPDLVATSQDNQIFVYLGLGNGSFASPFPVVAGSGLGAILLADVSGDGKLDVLVTSSVANSVAVLLGNGDGTFQAALNYSSGVAPQNVVVGDFNSDGMLDMASLSTSQYYSYDGNVEIFLNVGDGTFSPGASYLGYGFSTAAAAADFGGDGRVDLALGDIQNSAASVLHGNGDGTFDAVTATQTVFYPVSMTAGDFNGDGIPDVVVASSDTVQGFLSAGQGKFTPAAPNQTFSSLGAFSASGDFNGDGRLDIALLVNYSTVGILLGNGDGTFGTITTYPLSSNFGNPYGLAVGDFDGDGILDVASTVQNFDSTYVLSVLLGIGDGSFGPPVQTQLSQSPAELFTADFNGDGLADLALLSTYSSTQLQIFLASGAGLFESPASYPVIAGSKGMAAGDLRHSGFLDLVVGGGSTNTLAIFPGQANGAFGVASILGVGWPVSNVAIADFNSDGNPDLVTANSSYNASVLYGLGTGAFQAPKTFLVGVPFAVAAGDFDGNGKPDAVFSNSSGNIGITLLRNGALAAAVHDVSALVGSAAVIPAFASGFGPLSYQWRRNGTTLNDGGTVSGATTATLTIDPAAFTDADSYDVLVTDSCGTVASSAGTLSVEFADVPVSNIFHADILTIATAGVTAGCGGSDYCPTALVSRAQMAVFLLKSEHGAAYVPPACAGLFADVPCPSTYANWIEQLSNEGVTAGCGNGDYCPDSSITRAQMAVFLLKTSQGSGYVPPAATAIFDDVPVDAFGAAFIDDLYTRGIAGGCSASPLLYCPNNVVNRAQMAAFLVNTFF